MCVHVRRRSPVCVCEEGFFCVCLGVEGFVCVFGGEGRSLCYVWMCFYFVCVFVSVQNMDQGINTVYIPRFSLTISPDTKTPRHLQTPQDLFISKGIYTRTSMPCCPCRFLGPCLSRPRSRLIVKWTVFCLAEEVMP